MSIGGIIKLLVDAKGIKLPSNARKHVERRAAFAFSRFQENIKTARVTLLSIPPVEGQPSEGTHCRVEVMMDDKVEVVVSDIQSDLYHAVDRALFRASYTINQRIKRMYGQRNRAHYDYVLARSRVR